VGWLENLFRLPLGDEQYAAAAERLLDGLRRHPGRNRHVTPFGLKPTSREVPMLLEAIRIASARTSLVEIEASTGNPSNFGMFATIQWAWDVLKRWPAADPIPGLDALTADEAALLAIAQE